MDYKTKRLVKAAKEVFECLAVRVAADAVMNKRAGRSMDALEELKNALEPFNRELKEPSPILYLGPSGLDQVDGEPIGV